MHIVKHKNGGLSGTALENTQLILEFPELHSSGYPQHLASEFIKCL